MVNKPKNIGTATETAVVKALKRLGFPKARRLVLTGSKDQGDVEVCEGIILEVKGGNQARRASDGLVSQWLIETERERINAGAEFAALVVARPGIGYSNADRWWAVIPDSGLYWLVGGPMPTPDPTEGIAARMSLRDLTRLLHYRLDRNKAVEEKGNP